MKPTTKYDAAYLRYSSELQRESSTLEVQREQCERAAGHPLTCYIDEAKSGRSTAGRQQLHRLLLDASEGKVRTLYVLRMDRLGRDEADTFTTIAELKDYGVEIISVQEGREAVTQGIMAVMSAHYSRDLSIKTRNGLLKRHEQKTYTGGRPNYGYQVIERANRKILAINPDEAQHVKFIFDSYLGATPMGLKTIAATLNQKHIPTRSMKEGGKSNPCGQARKPAPWAKSSIRSILINPIYTGTIRYNVRTMKLNRQTGKRIPIFNDPSVHQVYQDEELRIIDQHQFEAVQKRLAGRKESSTGNSRSAKLIRTFTGLLFCESCGAAFYSRKSANEKGTYIYYQCGCRQRHGPSACENTTSLREDSLMADLQKTCSVAFSDIEAMVNSCLALVQKAVKSKQKEAVDLKKQLADLDTKIARYHGLVDEAKAIGEPMAAKSYMRQITPMEIQREQLQTLIGESIDKVDGEVQVLADRIRGKLVEAKERWESIGSPAEINRLISDLVGPSVVSVDGKLLPPTKNPVGTDNGAHGVIAGACADPVHILSHLFRSLSNVVAA